MKLAWTAPLLFTAACASVPASRPPARAADRVEVQVVQVGWLQLASGQPYRPPVEDLRHGRTPDPQEAAEIAQDVLDRCRKGESMDLLQRDFSEEKRGTQVIEPRSDAPFRDLALSLKPGECALYRSSYALHVLKRVG